MMVGLSVLGIAAMAGVGLSALWNNLMEDRKTKPDVVQLVRQSLDLQYQAAHRAGLSDADAMEQGKILIRTFRFGKDDYFSML